MLIKTKLRSKILKKNIASELTKIEHTRVFFFDESRFGTHSKIGHGWFETGKRSTVKIKLGYENFYLYSSVDIKDGDNFSLILSNVNTENMNIFLLHMSKEYKNDKMILIMDRAGWHKSKDLKIPDNITIVYLPPYAPELNPVERLWQYIKSKILKNILYETIEKLESVLCSFIKSLSNDTVKSICETQYMFN
jgi:transposase